MDMFDSLAVQQEQIEALFCSIEKALSEIENNPKERVQVENLFYILWDKVNELTMQIEEMRGHIKVCNAIYAVNRIDELKREIAALKGRNNQDT